MSLKESDLEGIASGLGVRAGRITNKSKLTVLVEISNFIEGKWLEGIEQSLQLLTILHNDLKELCQPIDDNAGVRVSEEEESEGKGKQTD